MARPTIKTYDNITRAFLQVGRADFKKVAGLCGQTTHLVKRAWETGFPQNDPSDPVMLPIKQVIEGEVLAAKAARASATRKLMSRHAQQLQDAIDDSAQQRAIEGMAVRSIMVAVDSLARETVQFTALIPKLQAKINELVSQAIDDPDFTLQQLQQLITWATANLDVLSKTAERAQSLERKFMGEADTTVRIVDQRTPEEKATNLVATLMALKANNRLSFTPSDDVVIGGMNDSATMKKLAPVIEAQVVKDPLGE